MLRTLLLVLLIASILFHVPETWTDSRPLFNGNEAYTHLVQQCKFGPRPPGSANLNLCRDYITNRLEAFGWNVVFQHFTYRGVRCVNLVARWPLRGGDASVLLGAHYDTRPKADNDPNPTYRDRPIIGANDGASGVAILMELARALPTDVRSDVELVFFDAEDSGMINGWDWIVGSTHYVKQLSTERKKEIRSMILLDMVGGEDLRFSRELYSSKTLQDKIWSIAHEMDYDHIFLDKPGAYIIDDHRPFLDVGIESLDLIHYPMPWYWHTIEDTQDKCSRTSLEIVGGVLEMFIVGQAVDHIPKTTSSTSERTNTNDTENNPQLSPIHGLGPIMFQLLVAVAACVFLAVILLGRHFRSRSFESQSPRCSSRQSFYCTLPPG